MSATNRRRKERERVIEEVRAAFMEASMNGFRGTTADSFSVALSEITFDTEYAFKHDTVNEILDNLKEHPLDPQVKAICNV